VNIPSLLNSLGLTTFANIVSLSGVLQTLQSPGPFTVFAPSNAAFNSIPSATLANLLNSPQLLTQIVLNQVVNGNHLSSSLSNGMHTTRLLPICGFRDTWEVPTVSEFLFIQPSSPAPRILPFRAHKSFFGLMHGSPYSNFFLAFFIFRVPLCSSITFYLFNFDFAKIQPLTISQV